MSRQLIAALPCRCNSTRLWGKPLQPLAPGLPIAEHLARSLRRFACVADVRLAIARGPGEGALIDLAERSGLEYLLGAEDDVLGRVIATAREAGATDVLRKTSEDPFFDISMLEPAWRRHLEHDNDVTALDLAPEGAAFEIFTLAALERCHELGSEEDREHIANYARFHQAEFAIEILRPEPACRRMDLRLTVDNPEDLIVCRAVFRGLRGHERLIPLREIVRFLDDRPELSDLVRPFASPHPTWEGIPQPQAPTATPPHAPATEPHAPTAQPHAPTAQPHAPTGVSPGHHA
jgi:spore coat polysaccharide biosynthesis protein SpsF